MQKDSVTTIYLVRHGEVHNPKGLVYGRLPGFGLSALGHEQAKRTARWLSGEPIAAIYTSPRLRARQTARSIARHHAAVRFSATALLDEIRTSWEGNSGEPLGKFFNFYEPKVAPSDETIAEIFARMQRLVERLRRLYRGKHVVCVGHGDPIIAARVGYCGLALSFENMRQAYPEQASLTILKFEDGRPLPQIRYVNPT